MAATFGAEWGRAEWGLARWGYPTFSSSSSGAAVIIGTGVMIVSGTIMGGGTANILGTGVFGQVVNCPPDIRLLGLVWPRLIPSIVMPIAYVIYLGQPTDAPQCQPNTTTIPVTESSATLQEGTQDPQYNQ